MGGVTTSVSSRFDLDRRHTKLLSNGDVLLRTKSFSRVVPISSFLNTTETKVKSGKTVQLRLTKSK